MHTDMHTEVPTTYYVWRRRHPNPELDGYVNATVYDPNHAPGKGADQSFDILLITEDWDEAKQVIDRCKRTDEILESMP